MRLTHIEGNDTFSALCEVNTKHPAAPDLAANLWAQLAPIDACLSAPAPDTSGSMRGDRLQVQWWNDPSGRYFAVQVLDTVQASQWEVFHVPAANDRDVAGCRVTWEMEPGSSALHTVWEKAFAPALGSSLHDARIPSFPELFAAGCSPNGVTAVLDNRTAIANLLGEVEYWTHLAKSLSKVQRPRRSHFVAPAPTATPAPAQARAWALSDIEAWAAENADRLIILPRAINATKRSPYENAPFLYECLELLATEYTQVKTGAADRFAFKTKADAMGLEYGGSVEPSRAGECGDQYFIRWGGRRRFLDQHLTKGNTRDPRYCMRIYFTFDEDTKMVVIGSMPGHLNTSTS